MNKLLKISILSLGMMTILAGAAVAPALEKINQYFLNAPPTLIKMVITLSAIFIY